MWSRPLRRHVGSLLRRSVGEKGVWGCVAARPCSLPALPAGGVSALQAADVWRRRFEEEGVTEPELSSRFIVAHLLGAKTMETLGREELSRPLTREETQQLWRLCSKRLSRMPVQYVIEEWDFRDLTLKMKPPVFIPRPETEELVELVLADLQLSPAGVQQTCLEVGCGSGAISLSLLKSRPQLTAVALDQSEDAVALTWENASRLGLQNRLRVYHMDIMKDPAAVLSLSGRVSVLVSNPPYLFTEDLASLEPEISQFEDRSALDGGTDGLKVIRQILALAPQLLSENGRVFLEVEPRHAPQLQAGVDGLRYVETRHDVSGRPRFCILKKEESEQCRLDVD